MLLLNTGKATFFCNGVFWKPYDWTWNKFIKATAFMLQRNIHFQLRQYLTQEPLWPEALLRAFRESCFIKKLCISVYKSSVL